jgi:outer membrane protein OmpA-like peptidoglycan-associated protein
MARGSLLLAGFFLAIVPLAGCAPAAGGVASRGDPAPLSSPAAVASFSPRPDDRDGDGIPDVRDRCPDEAEDCDGFEDDDGCPDLDDDGDSIADTCDKCPRVPGVPPDGCPGRRIRIQAETIRIVQYLHFGKNSDVLLRESLPIVDEAAAVMKATPDIEQIEAVGHASLEETGVEALSERRAKRARDALLARGVEARRVVARGVGSSQPIESNATEAGRARNRRAEWKVLRMASSPPVPVPPSVIRPPLGPPSCPGLASIPAPSPPPPGGCPQASAP